METPNQPQQEKEREPEEVPLDKNDPDSIYNWVAKRVSGPSFRNIIKDFIDDNCSLFIDIEENTFQQGQIFNEFNQLLENILGDVLEEGGLSQEQFLEAAQRGLEDKKYKKYFDQLLNFSDYNFFKRCMTKRNYALIKRFEEQIAQQKEEIEEQKIQEEIRIEEEKRKEVEKKIEEEKAKEENKGEKKEKTEKELKEEQERMLLYQMLNQEEEKELQEVIKQSLAMEEEKRRMAIIEEEELNRALKQSLLESTNPPKKEEPPKEKSPKKEEQKKKDYIIQKNEGFRFENTPKEEQKLPEIKKPVNYITSSNNSFQISNVYDRPKPEKPSNIISANKGFEFQIQNNSNNNFGITSSNLPEKKKEELIEDKKDKNEKGEIQYKDISINANKKPEIEKVEIQRKKEEIKEKKRLINNVNINSKPKENNFNIIPIEDNAKDENIIITEEIKTRPNQKKPIEPKGPFPEDQKASDIIKQSLNNDNKINENNNINNLDDNNEEDNNDFGGYDRLLISDDEDDEEKKDLNNEQKPLANAFIDNKKDINLGKVRLGKDGGNFLNNFSETKKYEKGGIEKLENKLRKEQIQSVVSNPNEDDDYLAKLREVEKEKNEKLKEYREKLTKMQKEKRENKAKQTLSPEELAKLQRREQLAEKLKAKRFNNNA